MGVIGKIGATGFGGVTGSRGVVSGYELPVRNGLALWLDAADKSTITTGATFTWADKSGEGNNSDQSIAGDQPVTGVNTLNGRNCINFTGDFLNISSTVNYRCAIVVMRNATGGVSALYGGDTPANGEYTFINTDQTDPTYDISIDGSTGKTGTAYFNGGVGASGTNIDLGNTNAENEGSAIWMVNYDQLNRADYIAAFGAGATTKIVSGSFAEILFYDRNLTEVELNQIGRYLGIKWNLPYINIS